MNGILNSGIFSTSSIFNNLSIHFRHTFIKWPALCMSSKAPKGFSISQRIWFEIYNRTSFVWTTYNVCFFFFVKWSNYLLELRMDWEENHTHTHEYAYTDIRTHMTLYQVKIFSKLPSACAVHTIKRIWPMPIVRSCACVSEDDMVSCVCVCAFCLVHKNYVQMCRCTARGCRISSDPRCRLSVWSTFVLILHSRVLGR